MISKCGRRWIAVAAALLMSGCGDLDVTNPNEPDRNRVLADGNDIQALIAGTFRTWWNLQQGNPEGDDGAVLATRVADVLSAAADVAAGSGLGGAGGMSDEPRTAVINDHNYRWGDFSKQSWFQLNRAQAAIRDGLQSIAAGVEVGEPQRLQAYAKLMQGLMLGHIAMLYDEGFVFDETTEDLEAVELQPYGEVLAGARAFLEQARQLSGQAAFTIPSGWIGNRGYSNEDLIRIAHSYEARLMAQVARTPEERAQVDWATVRSHAEQGITEDFGVDLDGPGGFWQAPTKSKFRVRLPFLGPADQSGGWQAWERVYPAASEKYPFLIDTDDRRVTGGTPDSNGTLIEYFDQIDADITRGLYTFSNYEMLHWEELENTSLGFAPDLTVEELQFYIAEAHIRTGQPELALPIVNESRASGELPPATVDGVAGDRCVPRNVHGECGDLLEALAWERQISFPRMSVGSVFYEMRGMGTLRVGTPLHFPVPQKELQTLQLDVYTTGGVDGRDAAPGPPGFTYPPA